MSLSRSQLVRRLARVGAVCLGFALWAAASVAPAQDPGYRVITNASNPASVVSRDFVADAFLKRVTTWPDGQDVVAVDLTARSPVRATFSEDVLGRSVAAMKSYWQQIIFSGRGVPPVELDSDELVVRFVATHPGALGYVSPRVQLAGVKVLNLK